MTLLPNGLPGAVFGSAWSTNDNGLINLSNLSGYLLSILHQMDGSNMYPSLYGDVIMQLTPVIQSYYCGPNQYQYHWNRHMPSVHLSIELDYG